jgi:hypothetical protein
MKTKTVTLPQLASLAAALSAKRSTAAAAAAAAAEAKRQIEALGLPAESVLLRSDDSPRTVEVAAIWTERPVREIAARVDTFHSFKVTKGE